MSGSESFDDIYPPSEGDTSYGSPDVEFDGGYGQEEVVERQLAHYTFVREERDREVRLHFRDTPPSEIARAFRSAGAYLISIMAERPRVREEASAQQVVPEEMGEESVEEEVPHRHKARARFMPPVLTGEVTLRYFYGLRETVYTVNIVSSTGIVESVAGLYPVAGRLEREVGYRGAVVFRPVGSAL